MDSFHKYLSQLYETDTSQKPNYLLSFFAAYGLYHLARQYILPPVFGFYKHYLRPRRNLVARYGAEPQKGWAVVTGASYGMGEHICYELAKSGFNIILIARSEDKLQTVASKLNTNYHVETRIITFDFQDLDSVEGVRSLFMKLEQVTDCLDVCVLVNNAGKAHRALIEDHSIEIQHQMLRTNVNGYLFMAQFFLKRFREKFTKDKRRSGMINISSGGAYYKMPQIIPYASTKGYAQHLSLGIQLENPHLDVLTAYPLGVKTQMNSGKGDPFAIEADTFAKSVIDQLGHDKETWGHISHGKINYVFQLPFVYVTMVAMYKWNLRKMEENKKQQEAKETKETQS